MALPDMSWLPPMDYDRIRLDFLDTLFNIRCDEKEELYMATRIILDSGIEADGRAHYYLNHILDFNSRNDYEYRGVCQSPLRQNGGTRQPSDKMVWFSFDANDGEPYWPGAEFLTFSEFIQRYRADYERNEITSDELVASDFLSVFDT